MKTLNNFAQKRINRLLETINIYKALCNYDLKSSLSLDEFNSNIKFQRQYINNHISSEISHIKGELNKDNLTKSFKIDGFIICIDLFTYDFYKKTLND